MTDGEERELPGGLAIASFGGGKFARVLQEVRSPEWSVVLLATNEEPYIVLYEMVFRLTGNRWAEVSGNDSPGWRRTGDRIGFVTVWRETKTAATQVTISYHGSTITRPVADGYYLGVFWNIPEDDFDPAAPPEVRSAS